jgi:CRISPR-associated protein Csy2
MSGSKAIILLPRLQVQSANAISGPWTWGFPSPTAFTGFVHALQRRLTGVLEKGFGGVGIICHQFDPQVSRPAGKYTSVFNLTRNPVGKDGGTAAIVEEGRAHMEVSLLITLLDSIDSDEREFVAQEMMEIAHTMRLAGGSILPPRQGKRYEAAYLALSPSQNEQDDTFRKLRRRLLPGFALVQREDRLGAHLNEMRETDKQANALDALLDLTRLNIEPDQPNPDNPEVKQWGIRKHPGWAVPIPVGYAAISPLYQAGEVRNARDNEYPFRFVESLYSLGEWVSPHRLNTLHQLLWHQQVDVEKGIYLCNNRYADFKNDTRTHS